MINYIILDKTTGIVDHCMQWGDGRIIASDYPLEANQEIISVDDTQVTVISGDVYNFTTGIFSPTTVVPVVMKTDVELLQDRCTALEGMINILVPIVQQ